jgi:hypothetical protein
MKFTEEKKIVNGVFKTVLKEQPEEYVGSAKVLAKAKRDKLLTESDWTQGNDSPLSDDAKAEWATYRQALRDITAHANFPNLEDADWPTKP